jgi:hypothetical protein
LLLPHWRGLPLHRRLQASIAIRRVRFTAAGMVRRHNRRTEMKNVPFDAIGKLVVCMYLDERNHYRDCEDETAEYRANHIWHSVKAVADWLDSVNKLPDLPSSRLSPRKDL